MLDQQIAVAAITMTSTADKAANIATAESYVRKAAAAGARWVLLPEMFSYMGPYEGVYEAAEPSDGPLNQRLAALAKELRITLFAGSVPERPDRSDEARLGARLRGAEGHRKVFNTFYAFSATGDQIAKYRKIHLFELREKLGNQALYSETMGYLAGDKLCVFEHEGWRIAATICYDLRFPDLYAAMARAQALDLILMPAAFTYATGERHWQLLLSARAVEQQCFVLAANQSGQHAPGKVSWGHSMIVDPWGEVLANTLGETGIAATTLSKETLARFRHRLPALANRRYDLY